MTNREIEEEELIPNNENDTYSIVTTRKNANKSIGGFFLYSSKVNWLVFCFICFFTLGSWLDISGIWCELPYMVDQLTEGWRLPSILTAISQIAQIGPFLYMIFKLIFPNKFKLFKVIYFILTIGAISCLLLSLFWNKTGVVLHEKRSIYLYIFNFSLSLLDGMSTLTFLPYIGENFSKEYIIPNYIGESLSSLIPGVLAMIQDSGREAKPCNFQDKLSNFSNATNSTINIINIATYSVSTYFAFLFALIIVSIISFSMLNYSKVAINARKKKENEIKLEQLNVSTETDEHTASTQEILEEPGVKVKKIDKLKKRILFFLAFLVCFINYGYLPGLLSYSTIPYGNWAFKLSINLVSITMPLSVFASIWSYDVGVTRIVIETLIPTGLSMYILAISVFSPCPPLVNHPIGGYLIIASWVLCSCFFMRARLLIATKLEQYGQKTLFIYACFNIIGQFFGGILIYLLVEVYRLFKDKDKCSLEVCK